MGLHGQMAEAADQPQKKARKRHSTMGRARPTALPERGCLSGRRPHSEGVTKAPLGSCAGASGDTDESMMTLGDG